MKAITVTATTAEVLELQQQVRRIRDLYEGYRQYFGCEYIAGLDDDELEREVDMEFLAAGYDDVLFVDVARRAFDELIQILEAML